MTFAELKTLIGDLTNDPSHDRYTNSQIATELDNSQDKWNVEARVIKDTVTLTVTGGVRQYAISGLTGTVIGFGRVTHKGLLLQKVDKNFLDLYTGVDWTAVTGTPTRYVIEATDPDVQYISLYPTPTDGDAGAYLVVEYIKRHTAMSADSDVPFMSGTSSNSLIYPYHWGLAYDVAARLLARDPSEINTPKSVNYAGISRGVMADVVQVFKAIEQQEPAKLKMPMHWRRR